MGRMVPKRPLFIIMLTRLIIHATMSVLLRTFLISSLVGMRLTFFFFICMALLFPLIMVTDTSATTATTVVRRKLNRGPYSAAA